MMDIQNQQASFYFTILIVMEVVIFILCIAF